jgi:L-fuconolactonase
VRIDSHQHVWHYDPGRDTWITDEMSVLKRDFLNPSVPPTENKWHRRLCHSSGVQSMQETLFLLDLAREHSEIKGVVGWIDLRADDLAENLERLSRFDKLRGFRHIVQSERDDHSMLNPAFCRGIGQLEAWSLNFPDSGL